MIKKLLPAIVLVLSLLVFFHPILKGQIPFPGDLLVGDYTPWNSYSFLGYAPGGVPNKAQGIDVVRQLYPWKKLVMEQMAKGEWPLWNPFNFSGNPLLANFQTAAFYPLNIVLFLPFNLGWTIFIVLQPLLGFVFMYLFLRQKKLSPVSCIFGSIAFSYSLYMTVWLEWGNIGHTFIWLPLILFTIDKLRENFSFRWLLLYSLAIVFAILAGYIQLIIYIFFLTFFYYFYQHFDSRNWQTFIKKTLVLVFFTLLAVAVCSLQLIPSLEIFVNSARNIYSSETLSKLLMPWFNIATIFAPDFFGNPAYRNYWLEGTYIERVSYVGILPLIFSFYAILGPGKGKRFFIISGLVSLLLAINFLPAQLFYALKIPIIGTAVPTRILAILSFSLAVLGAYGIEEFILQKKYQVKKFLILPAVFLIIWILIFTLSKSTNWLPTMVLTSQKNLFISSLILIVCSILILTAMKFQKWKKLVIWIFITATIFDLYFYFWRITPFSPPDFIYPESKIVTLVRNKSSFWRNWGYGTGYIESNLATEQKIFSPDGYDPLYIKRYGELVSSSDNGLIKNSLPRSDVVVAPGYGEESLRENSYRKRILDLLGVRYILHKNEKDKKHDTATFPPDRYKLLLQEGVWQIYENLHVVSRFFLTSNYLIEKNHEKIIKILHDQKFDPQKTIILEKNPKMTSLQSPNDSIKLLSYLPNEVRFRINIKEPNLLFLSDNYYPGWDASVDGNPKEIYRADYTFRAVIVPAGDHLVVFSYKPTSFFMGLKITIIIIFIYVFTVTYVIYKKIYDQELFK